LGLALHRQLTQRLAIKVIAHDAVGGLGDKDAARFGNLLHPRSRIDGVTDRGEIHLQVVGHRADDDRARC
jgi:hypothetical protein